MATAKFLSSGFASRLQNYLTRNIVVRENGCWEFIGIIQTNGYGTLKHNHSNYSAHRVMYAIVFGDVPADMCVLHRCDWPPCVNPAHLWLGTQLENIEDMRKKGRQAPVPVPKPKRGEDQWLAKLNDVKVREIRRKYADGCGTMDELAIEYDVSLMTIQRAVRRHTWAHVD